MKLSAWTGMLFVLLFQQTFGSFISSTEECGPGERCSTSESCAFCEDCEDGKYTSAVHTSHECHDCNYGEFSSTLNGTNCVCVPGAARWHLEVNSTWGWSNLYNCSQCAPGSSQGKHKIWSQSACEHCLPGTYVDIIGASTCLNCPMGTFTSSSGATTCDTCLSGTVPRPARDACDACLPGTYAQLSDTTCTQCADGFFTDTNASTNCRRCTPGFIPSTRRDACNACPVGTFGQHNASICNACPDSFFSDTNASTTCQRCTPGFIPSTRRDACDACPAGTFSEPNASTCTACPLGTYAPSTNSTTCQTCPAGMVSLASRAGCADCLRGTYFYALACRDCPAQHYQPDDNQNFCLPCPSSATVIDNRTDCACLPGATFTHNASTCCATLPRAHDRALVGWRHGLDLDTPSMCWDHAHGLLRVPLPALAPRPGRVGVALAASHQSTHYQSALFVQLRPSQRVITMVFNRWNASVQVNASTDQTGQVEATPAGFVFELESVGGDTALHVSGFGLRLERLVTQFRNQTRTWAPALLAPPGAVACRTCAHCMRPAEDGRACEPEPGCFVGMRLGVRRDAPWWQVSEATFDGYVPSWARRVDANETYLVPENDVVVSAPRERSVELRARPHKEDDPREVAEVCRQDVVNLRVGAEGGSAVQWSKVNDLVAVNASSTPAPPPPPDSSTPAPPPPPDSSTPAPPPPDSSTPAPPPPTITGYQVDFAILLQIPLHEFTANDQTKLVDILAADFDIPMSRIFINQITATTAPTSTTRRLLQDSTRVEITITTDTEADVRDLADRLTQDLNTALQSLGFGDVSIAQAPTSQANTGTFFARCPPGFTPTGPTCAPCTAGFFKALAGNASCLACSIGKFMPSTAAKACLDCGAVSSTYTVTGLTAPDKQFVLDQPLVLTTGQQVTVNWTLSPPEHPFRISTRSSDPFSEPGSDVLTEVVDENAKTTTLTLHKLEPDLYYTCPNQHNFIGVLVQRKASDAKTTLAVASPAASECTCVTGKFLDPETLTCTECIIGSFKPDVGAQACTLCGSDGPAGLQHHYGSGPPDASSATHCVPCPGGGSSAGQDPAVVNFASPMDGMEDCQCFPGFEAFDVGTGCSACTGFRQRSTYAREACAVCAAGKYFVAADQDCESCALQQQNFNEFHSEVANQANPNADWASSRDECTCRAGFERVGDECSACAQGKYRVDLFEPTCLHCEAKQYFVAADQECGTCALQQANSQQKHSEVANQANPNADWASSRDECTCRAGFERVGDECSACAQGKYRVDLFEPTCMPCEKNKYQDETGSTACKPCPDGKGTAGTGSVSVEECQAPATPSSPPPSSTPGVPPPPSATPGPPSTDDSGGATQTATSFSSASIGLIAAVVGVLLLGMGCLYGWSRGTTGKNNKISPQQMSMYQVVPESHVIEQKVDV